MVKSAQIIEAMGGAAKVARDLGLPEKSGVQTVHNWKTRGIPARIQLDHLDYFRKAEKLIARKAA